jgi:hypothetical protein
MGADKLVFGPDSRTILKYKNGIIKDSRIERAFSRV